MRPRKCCVECSRRRKKLSECKPRGPGNKCWTCAKWNRDCSFVTDYPATLAGLEFAPCREERRAKRARDVPPDAAAAASGSAESPRASAAAAGPAGAAGAAFAAVGAAMALSSKAPAGDAFREAAESAARATPAAEAAEVAILALAAAAPPPERSLVVSVPSMMCLSSCAATIRVALEALPATALAGVNVPRRLVHCKTGGGVDAVLSALDSAGFPGTLVSAAAGGDRLDGGAWADADETSWDLADSLGLVARSCNVRTGGSCSCGPACMCHFCPVHHPDRTASLVADAASNGAAVDLSHFANSARAGHAADGK